MFKSILTVLIILILNASARAEPIHVAAQNGEVDRLLQILANGVPVDLPSTRDTSKPGVSALMIAAQWGRVGAVEALLDAGADPNFVMPDERLAETPFMLAVKTGRTEIFDLMIAAGADPNFTTPVGTPIHLAKLMRRAEMEGKLMEAGAEQSVSQPPITMRLGGADPARGRQLSRHCQQCHGDIADRAFKSSGGTPAVWDIVGKEKGRQADAKYSDALESFGGTWTYDDLNSFLANPGAFIPGTAMWGTGLSNETDRVDLIAYIRTLSDNPVPLPQ